MVHPTDKGDGIVVMSKTYYKEEMERILRDRVRYHLLTNNSAVSFEEKLAKKNSEERG